MRQGAAIDLVLERSRENRSKIVYTAARGREAEWACEEDAASLGSASQPPPAPDPVIKESGTIRDVGETELFSSRLPSRSVAPTAAQPCVWARSRGMPVPDRGPLPVVVRNAWHDANT